MTLNDEARLMLTAAFRGRGKSPLREYLTGDLLAKRMYTLLQELPQVDPVLKKNGKDISVYQELRELPPVVGAAETITATVRKLELSIERGKASAADTRELERIFADIDVPGLLTQAAEAYFFGWMPFELVWSVRPNTKRHWYPHPNGGLIPKRHKYFYFDTQRRLHYHAGYRQDARLAGEFDFLVARNAGAFGDPRGRAMLGPCFWYQTFFKAGLKQYVQFLERFVTPWIGVHYKAGLHDSKVREMVDTAVAMLGNGVVALPEGSRFQFMESAGKGQSADIFERFLRFCKEQITGTLLGGVLAHDTGQNPSFAQAKEHGKVTQARLDGICAFLCGFLNDYIRLICKLNFGEKPARPRALLFDPERKAAQRAERDKFWSDTKQVEFTLEYLTDVVGYDAEHIRLKSSATPPPAEDPEPDIALARGIAPERRALEQHIDNLNDTELQAMMAGVIRPVLDELESAGNYKDALAKLARIYPEMDSGKLQENLHKFLFVAEAIGHTIAAGKE